MSNVKSTELRSFHEVQSVFFRNTNAMTHAQVTERFSKFGVIESIHQTGTVRGLCFVKFASEQSAKHCALGMKDDKIIRLRPFDPQCPNRAYKLRPGYCAARRLQKARHSVSNQIGVSPSCDTTNLIGKAIKTANSLTYSSILSTTLEKESNNEITSLDDDTIESSFEYFEIIQPMSREESIAALSHVSRGIPEIVKKVTMISGDANLEKSFYVLMRSRVEWEDLHGVDVEYVPAVAIVIGNIPMTCGVEFLLDLFEDYRPLVASKIKSIHEETLRYCYIYFRDSCDCKAVEQRYDNTEVYGNNLVVQCAKILRKTLMSD